MTILELYYLTVLVYTKTIIYLIVGATGEYFRGLDILIRPPTRAMKSLRLSSAEFQAAKRGNEVISVFPNRKQSCITLFVKHFNSFPSCRDGSR